MCAVIRGESWALTFGNQYRDDGIGLSNVEYSDSVVYPAYCTFVPGIFQTATMPDPTFDFQPFWAYGTSSDRNAYISYKGRAVFSGSIHDVVLLGGQSLRIPYGPCATTCTASGTLGSTTMNAAHSAGATTLTTGDTTNFTAGDPVRVGVTGAHNVEYHMAKTVNVNTSIVIYQHVDVSTWAGGTPSSGETLTGSSSGKTITVQFATNCQIHGDCSGDFTVGETLSGGGHSCVVVRQRTGIKHDHANADPMVECTDVLLDTACGSGSLSFDVLTASDWSSSDYVCIGYGSRYAEIRQVTKSSATLSFSYPLVYDHGLSPGITKMDVSGGVYTHTIYEDNSISPFHFSAVYEDVNAVNSLQRRYIGVKCNRATFRASEGEIIRMSFDELIARTMRYNDDVTSAVSPFYSANITSAPTPSYVTTEPYYFSYGAITFAGSTVARVRDFNLEVNNNIEPKYYVNDSWDAGRVPYELREGRREYRLSLVVDVDDSQRNLFADLLRQGDYSGSYTGFQVTFTITRGSNDTITFTLPPSSPAAGGDSQGCLIRDARHNIMDQPLVSVPVDILARSCRIVVQDSIYYYP